ncbi:unnamed protein product [Prunus armeniaca]
MVNMIQTKQNKENKYKTATGKEKESIVEKALKPATRMNCFFCKKARHMRRDCRKYKRWLEKNKGEGNSNLILEFTNKKLASKDEVKVFMGNGEEVQN